MGAGTDVIWPAPLLLTAAFVDPGLLPTGSELPAAPFEGAAFEAAAPTGVVTGQMT